jgi:hypothetical protein
LPLTHRAVPLLDVKCLHLGAALFHT